MVIFCITCKGRAQHIEQTLPQNMWDNPAAKFVLLNYNSQDHLGRYLIENHLEDMWLGRLVVYKFEGGGPFHMAHAKNMVHRCAMLEGGTILVNLDADNFTGPGFASYLEDEFRLNPNAFLWARMIKDGAGRLPKGISGRIAVSAHAFLNAGGYDERFDTWGPDDKDFTARVRRLGYEPREIDPCYLKAIMHNDKMRFREYKHVQTDAGCYEGEVFEGDATIRNFGNFGCGTVYRNFNYELPIELAPLPTRIFGIGLHKTATTSLHAALSLLGFDSAHWKSARWARLVWREMMTAGRSLTMERNYAFCDLPFPVLFRELDAAYPGSKFILTTRDEAKWIDSVRRHWNPQFNPYRNAWADDPFTHKVHKLVYGQKGFDAELFLNRYRRHNAEVLKYFKDRPGDLLVMNMDPTEFDVGAKWEVRFGKRPAAGWPELCGFLGRSVPSMPYPKEFRTRSKAEILGGEVPQFMAAKTQWQKQQQRDRELASASQIHHPPTPKGPPWWVTLIAVLEEIWAALPASHSEPNHPVAQKLAALKNIKPE